MIEPLENRRRLDRVVLLFVFALLFFTPTFILWWTMIGSPWYLPYLIWLGLIILAAWLQQRRGHHDL